MSFCLVMSRWLCSRLVCCNIVSVPHYFKTCHSVPEEWWFLRWYLMPELTLLEMPGTTLIKFSSFNDVQP